MQTQGSYAHDNATLITAQREIELRSATDGYNRYIKQQDSTSASMGGHSTSEAVKMIRGSIPLVSAEVTKWIEANTKPGRGKRHAALAVLNRFDPDVLAFLALNSIFAGITKEHTVAAIQTHIGGQIEAEVMALDIQQLQDKKVAARLKAVTAKQGSARNARKAFNKLAHEHLPEHEAWTQDVKVRVAEPLVNAVLLALAEMFELKTLSRGKNDRQTVIRLTDAGVEMFGALRESMAWMQPIHRPMVVPPRPWTSMDTGCYYEERSARTVKLVRTFNKDHAKLVRAAIADGSMDYVLEAVNAIQSTAWAINRPIFELVRWVFEEGIGGLGVCPNKLMDVPPRMEPEVWSAMTDEQRKGHRIELGGIHERNRAIVSDQAVLLRDLETAKDLLDFDSFYLPHSLDFRGRVYPVPHFSQQRADPIKAMFRFAEGHPLGEFGIGWLSVHLANCGDFEKVSKKSYDARLQWVEDNEAMILAIGENPYATLNLWADADSPFMFVAACLEYAAWAKAGRQDTFVSYLAVALDGSNSGLQHYSAALRATDEAALVSLLPCDHPADLYQTVADTVQAEMELEAAEGHELAIACLKVGVSRKLVKRNVMTFAYSSEQFGFRQQIMTDTMGALNEAVFLGKAESNPYAMPRKDKEGNLTGEMDRGFAASGYLAAKVWQAVTRVVTTATEGMAFFKAVAGALAHEAKPLVWTTPVGLPVMHKYSVWDVKTVELFLYDRAMAVTEAKGRDKLDPEGRGVLRRVESNIRTKPQDRIDKEKARSAVAPNVIHSMDGSHLMLTVLSASGRGIEDFALIHDSFGTHAGKTQAFFQIIREAFVEMYDNYCPFEEVYQSAYAVLSDEGREKLPVILTKGDMDLSVVLDAPYAFA